MAATQVHLIDPCGGLILVLCADGSRVLFGNQIGIGSTNDVLQRLFEVLEDGAIDYFVYAGMDSEGAVSAADITEFFPVKSCLELTGEGVEYPQSYLNFRGDREVETVERDDVMEFGDTRIRLIAATATHVMPEGKLRPVVMHVTHGEGEAAVSVLCAGMTNGVDWLEMNTFPAEDLRADCLIVDGRRPLDLIVTTRPQGLVSAAHLRTIAPRTVVLGADAGGTQELRVAARELFAHFARMNPGGDGVIEVKKNAWFALMLDHGRLKSEQEPRAIGKVA
jgi:hypothetical protein